MLLRRWSLALVVLACVVPDVALAQNYTPLIVGWEQFFTITSETARVGGRPRVVGYLQNESGSPARRIQLLIEGLDASGKVTGQTIAWFGHDLTAGARGYFDVPAPPGAHHRVSVFAFDFVQAASLNGP
jgi:hypothetical protein